MMCLGCKEWGYIIRDCPNKVAVITTDESEGEQTIVGNEQTREWAIVEGKVGCNDCNILLDSGAQISVIAKDLVHTRCSIH